jgi:hypothetical protein
MLLIDPVLAFLDTNVNTANDASVCRALRPLIRLAARHRCILLLVRHLNKSGGHKAAYRGLERCARRAEGHYRNRQKRLKQDWQR